MAIDSPSDPVSGRGDHPLPSSPPRRPRPGYGVVAVAGLMAAAVVLVDVITKWLADTRLPGAAVDLGIGRLQLSHNTGVAFSVGDGLPGWMVLGLTSLVTAGVAVAIVLGLLAPPVPAGLVLGGAVANIVDRVPDGAVTDFLWLGWFPTFNLADTAITLGALGLLWGAWRGARAEARSGSAGVVEG
ncbi:signal peptidase II [Pseudonocardia sp. RS010]|uniref:signal peptidase II n=1 Tax=Pseudonocardia sp. RS010 TaxID=3385979 RepID=UPI00399F703E